MLISRSHSFLFIHVPKTGGTALALALARYCGIRARIAHEGGNIKGLRRLIVAATGGQAVQRLTGFDAHTSYADARKVLGADLVDPLFCFAVVRNPFIRALSMYEHIRRVKDHPAHYIASASSFAVAMPELLENWWFNQASIITHPETGRIATDQLLAYETLGEDLKRLECSLGLRTPLRLATVNVGSGKRPDVAAAFAGQADRFVGFLEKDFQLLGYSKDPADAHLPPMPS